MATVELEELGSRIENDGLDLGLLVNDATWKDLLMELVRKNKLDPGNIDIAEIVNSYVETVRALRVMDLRVPANIILAAAVLLRLKSEVLSFETEEQEMDEPMIDNVRSPVEVATLIPRVRLPRKSKVTLNELVEALDEAMKVKEKRSFQANLPMPEIPIMINAVDMEAEVDRLYNVIKEHVDSKNMTTFSYLVGKSETEDALLGLFIPLLFLGNRTRVTLLQEKFFEEIIIALN